MDQSFLPAGYYECPKCNGGIEVHVPLSEAPYHRCGVGRKLYTMVYKGAKSDKTRNSIRGLGQPEEDS
jgi:hypothetical protein